MSSPPSIPLSIRIDIGLAGDTELDLSPPLPPLNRGEIVLLLLLVLLTLPLKLRDWRRIGLEPERGLEIIELNKGLPIPLLLL